MSVAQEVADVLSGTAEDSTVRARANLDLAQREVNRMLSVANSSVFDLCMNIENARSKATVKAAFTQFNASIRFFLEAAPDAEDDTLVRDTLCATRVSERLEELLRSSSSVEEALREYKVGVVTELAGTIRAQEAKCQVDNKQDDELLLRLLPEPTSPLSDLEHGPGDVGASTEVSIASSRKRGFADISSSPVQGSSPPLASFARMQELVDHGCVSKRQALLTREKLRAGMHDPRGLLKMVGSSTNALERAKKMEILKSAGFMFGDNKKSQGKISFADKLNMATIRLELGLGGHALSDTLLFGAKVLSIPGFLTPKNVLDIEHNLVGGKTTWKHQKAYAKMVIAGYLNQAKSIFEKYDDILYGPAPEKLVEETHEAVRELLTSPECKLFLDQVGDADKSDLAAGDNFVRKITEAVSPIIPITLTNKSLDGGYFRTALQLVAAAEFMFSQFDTDVRMHANPAGVVGMCNMVHGEIKRAAMYNDELKALPDFMKEVKTQYQTSLGLGASFARDAGIQGNRRGRRARGRAYYRSRMVQGQGPTRLLGSAQQEAAAEYPSGRGRGAMYQRTQALYGNNPVPMRGRGVCYDFQAGNCTRGRGCRFLHWY